MRCILLTLAVLILPMASPAQFIPASPLFASDHILVKFRNDIRDSAVAAASTNALTLLAAKLNLPAGSALSEPAISRLLRTENPAFGLANRRLAAANVDLSRFLYLRLPPGWDAQSGVRTLAGHPLLDYVELDHAGTAGVVPNDPIFGIQWHHANRTKPSACIHTPAAWDITSGSADVLVAVLDTGLNSGLAEFTDRVVPGYNFVAGNSNTSDDNDHGTSVAGTLAENANNGLVGAGVDWHCRILPVKVLDAGNFGYYSWWAQGVDYAVNRGARIINLSAGGTTSDFTLSRAISNAIAQGVIFVTITHNDGSGSIRFPGTLTECITVGATDEQDRRCAFSNFGPQIDLVAPGTNINTVGIDGTWWYWWGTSFAAPQVAGVCSLVLSLKPDLTPAQVRNLLCLGADDAVGDATDTPGFDNYYGWGRLNAPNSLLLASTRIDQASELPGQGGVALSWASPANASNKQPYQVSFTTNLNGGWTLITSTNGFSYAPSRTYWRDDGSLNGASSNRSAAFYRVQLKNLP